jgi:hypothetical protein
MKASPRSTSRPARPKTGAGAAIAALILAATPPWAQSTLIQPQPGGGYQIIPPQGFSTTVLPLPGGQGWIVIPPPGEGSSTTVLPLPGSGPQPTPGRSEYPKPQP